MGSRARPSGKSHHRYALILALHGSFPFARFSPSGASGSPDYLFLPRPSAQIPSFYPLLDRINAVLDPDVGLVGVTDFYTSKDAGTARERAIGSSQRKVNWFSRWFWQIW